MHRSKVRVATDVLDANETIARANREDFDRAGVRVVNLMSAPGAGKTALLERVLMDGLGEVRVGVLEGDVQGSLDAERLSALHVPVTQLNTDPGFGGECHLDANMVRSALGAIALEEIDLLVIENVGNLVCPAEFRVGEDRARDDLLGHRGRGQAAEVPADVPRVRAGRHQQDRPAAPPGLLARALPRQPRPGQPGRRAHARERAHGRGRARVRALARGRGVSGATRSPAAGRAWASRMGQPESVCEEMLALRTDANERFFASAAEPLARLCQLVAERFWSGGRLIAIAHSPQARSDARHVAVEFVHPVIVGKRALPARALTGERARCARRSS